MDARELRIGNWVSREDLFDRSPRYTQIIFLGEKATVTGPIKVICDYEDLTGIPLSEEWLIKFGFEKRGGEYTMENFRYNLLKTKTYDGMLFSDGQTCLTAISWVHHLQNVWFALTGEELTPK